MIAIHSYENEEKSFGEFRRKVRSAEVLSAAMERLLRNLHFSGKVSVVVQNERCSSRDTRKVTSASTSRARLQVRNEQRELRIVISP